MPQQLKPPNRVDPLNFPVFGMSWFANPGDGFTLLAMCGGGGSAKTGVNNAIIILDPTGDEKRIETGEQVGVSVKICQNPISGTVWLLAALGKKVERYHLPSGEKQGEIEVDGDGVNAIVVSAMLDTLACGCENGEVKVYDISDDSFDASGLLYTCYGHESAVCSVDFSIRGGRLISSAKDGTARVWQDDTCIRTLTCSVEGGTKSARGKVNPNRPVSVLVRGCAFGDLDGRLIYTVASGRKGSAFVARWVETPEGFQCDERTECSDVPISAMNLSGDFDLLTLGSVDGCVILWSTQEWKPRRTFQDVHDLPVTCIAARPFNVPLQGEEDGVRYDAISASADSRLAYLTLMKKAPKQKKPGDESFFAWFWNTFAFWIVFFLVLLRPLILDYKEKCAPFPFSFQCLTNEVLLAPSSYPGVAVPPY